jgi:glycosyltransferase involved in cell wall biosynthesis
MIANGINLEEFKIPYSKEECRKILGLPIDKNIILFFGYLVPYKSPDILLKAFPKILKQVSDTLLIFAGNGVMEEELKRLSIELNIDKYIIFAGYVGKEHRPLYYKASDIFCLPSTMRTECHPIAILEAMACSIPIVASKIGGIPDIVKDGENGLLVPPKDENALADVIIYLLENKDIRERMGRGGREKVERYSWEKIAKETEKIYEELI